MTPWHTRKLRWTFAAALAVFGGILFSVARTESADPPAPQKTLLDKPVPGIRTEKPIAADSVIELLQDSASVTITVDWEKLGTRGDKGVTLDLKPMPCATCSTASSRPQAPRSRRR